MARKIDINKWNRKQHFNFFKDFDNPFFNLTLNVDCTNLFDMTRRNKLSSFVSYIYLSLQTAIDIEEFRFRIVNDEVICYDTLMAGSTILTENNTFVFAYFDYNENFKTFHDAALEKIKSAKTETALIPGEENGNVIHYSTIPWVSFTGLQHARHHKLKDSVPKIVFGKTFNDGDRLKLPMAIDVHHALMDGYHVGKYIERFQKYLDEFSL